jgi:hypothetical protein
MSGRKLEWAHRQVMTPNCALVLHYLCWKVSDKRGFAWPSHGMIAARCNGISISTVKRCLRDLERLGAVEKKKLRVRDRWLLTYTINTDRRIYWKRKVNNCSWSAYIKQEEEKLSHRHALPGEDRGAFVRRQIARRVTSNG